MPSGFALPPVECWRGTRPSQAANSFTESSTVAHGGDYGRSRQLPTPGIYCSRWQAGLGRDGTSRKRTMVEEPVLNNYASA